MKYIKKFENFDNNSNSTKVNEDILKVDMAKVEDFVNNLISKIKNSKLSNEIRKFAALQKFDPYSNFKEIVNNIKWKFGEEPELRDPDIQRLLSIV